MPANVEKNIYFRKVLIYNIHSLNLIPIFIVFVKCVKWIFLKCFRMINILKPPASIGTHLIYLCQKVSTGDFQNIYISASAPKIYYFFFSSLLRAHLLYIEPHVFWQTAKIDHSFQCDTNVSPEIYMGHCLASPFPSSAHHFTATKSH